MAAITLAKAIKAFESELAPGGGIDGDREEVIDAITEGIEWVLQNGGGNILREWKVVVREGKFTLPRDLEIPIKFKFSRLPDDGFGTFHSSYYSYGSAGLSNCSGYYDYETNIEVKTNPAVTQFKMPLCGGRIVATTRNPADVGKKIMVGGKSGGLPIMGMHNGFKTSGEILTIYAENDSAKKYSSYVFDEVTSVVKDETCDYMMLSALDADNQFYHLGFYHPDDTAIAFTECELFRCSCWNHFDIGHYQSSYDYTIHILGRVNPSIRYIRDEDVLPITSLGMLKLLSKRARYDESGDFKEAAVIEQRLQTAINKQIAYQQKASRVISVNLAGSGATLANI